MTIAVYQLVARLPSTTGLSEDVVENVFHVGVDGAVVGTTEIGEMMAAIRDFYITVPAGGTQGPGYYLSDGVSRAASACTVLAYISFDLDGSTPLGSPIGTLSFTLQAAQVAAAFPEEVASVISYHGDLTDVPVSQTNPSPPPATIRPAQRRRGRCYIGPLSSGSGTDPGASIRPSSTFRSNLALAMKDLAETINAIDPNLFFGIWSKADAEVYECVGGYVDDAWDTQRRRGLAATTRTLFTVT